MTIAKASEEPVVMALAHDVARKVTEVVEYAVRVHPAGGAVEELKVDPELMRNRIS